VAKKCIEYSSVKNYFYLFKIFAKKIIPESIWKNLKFFVMLFRWTKVQCGKIISRKQYIDQLSNYKNQILKISEKVSSNYVEITSKRFKCHPNCPKTIAFYLPQFHPFPENDEWWGKGFTEWSNVTKSMPLFVGHYQPRLPIDLGFYDLRLPDVMHRQIELAKLYGIYGFCFHYYWFSGKRLMERPLFNFIEDKTMDFPFCLCWANEPWSRRWDGSEDDLLIGQELRPDDDGRFIKDLVLFFNDSRYIKIDGKPVLVIYRPHYWDKARVLVMTANFRNIANEYGFQGLYLVAALTFDYQDDPRNWGFDAGVEFPPHMCGSVPHVQGLHFVHEHFKGAVMDMSALVDAEKYMTPSDYPKFKTVFPSWDNSARKSNNAIIFHNCCPDVYKKWFKNALDYTYKMNSANERFVFVNAWNEWAEGAYLEPDRVYGYAFLQATKEALEEFSP